MQTRQPSAKESFARIRSQVTLQFNCRKLLQFLLAVLLLQAGNITHAQTSTCTGATTLTPVNAASCTPGTTFNISTNNTSLLAPYSTCATGVLNPGNGWAKFTANSSTASISYTPQASRNAMIFAYSGICGVLLTQIGCVNTGGNGVTETLNLSGLSAGTDYFIRIVRFNSTGNMNGSICVASLGTITTGSITGSPFCAGSNVSVPFTSTGAYTGNTYTAQLSNASGSFASPTNIGTLVSNANSGTITATIPIATGAGSGYRIRVISNGPSITGSDNGLNLTVNAAPTISGTLSVCEGSTTTLTGSGTPAASNPWVSATTSVATVNSSGVVTGVAAGSSVITYTNNIGCSRTVTVTVNAKPTISGTLIVCANSTITLTGSGTPAASNPWVSATTSVATVNSSGVVSGVAAGTSIITYTDNNGCNRTATVTVNAQPTISGTLSVCTGFTTALTGSGTPAASNPWVSATTSVATVNSSGVVSGVTAGTSIITYTDNNSCSKTATVTVNTTPAATGVTICVGGSGSLTSSATCPGGGSSSSGPNNAGTAVNNTAVGTGAWSTPGNITTTGSPYATQNLVAGATSNYLHASNYGFAIPAGATITGITVNIRRQVATTSSMFDNIVSLVKGGAITGNDLSSGTAWPNSFGVATYGGSGNLWGTTWTASDINASNFGVVLSATSSSGSTRQLDVDYIQITVSYTTNGTLNWYTVSSGGSAIGSGTPFNPVGVAGSGLANTNTAGTTSFYAECAAAPGCRGQADFVINALPTITTASTAAAVCFSGSAQNSTLAYSATTGSPTLYSITWDAAALSAGLANLANTAITSSPLSIPIAANTTAGTYNGTIAVSNAGCTGSSSAFTITINALPTITASATGVSKCFSSSSQTSGLTYSGTTGSPTNYTITWDAVAQAAGLVNLGSTAISSSSLVVYPVAAGTAGGVYNGTLTVTNSLGCSSTGNAFTQQIVGLPTITIASTAANKCFNSSTQSSTLTYSASTNSPTLYSVTWDAAAQSAGLANLALTNLPVSPMTVPVAAGVIPGTYNGSINVMNGFGCLSSSGAPFTLTIIAGVAPVMTSASSATICSGETVNIPLTSSTPSTYTWIAADNTYTTGESLTLQTTSTLNNTLINTVTTARNVTYTVRPTSTGGCEGAAQTVTVTVNPAPSITASATAAARCYNTSAQTSTLSYSATTSSPATYNITWNAAALSAGLVNSGNVSLPGSPITFSIPASVAPGTYTGSLTVATSAGCNSPANSFTLTINSGPTISSQPVSTTVCSGSATSFSITASGSGLTYQWRKGTSNLCNCGTVSGVTTSTLSISSVVAGDAAANYNCVVYSSGCSNVISDYATLTVNPAGAAPTALPKDLVFPTVSTTSVLGSFTPSSDATNYLVIRKTTNVAPTNPSNGTTYALNSTTLTGTVDYVGTNISFTSNGLTPGTTYYYWVFPYNTSSCGTSPLYLTSTPLTGEVTTGTNVACGTVTTLYWGGTGSSLSGAVSGTDFNTASNWSTSSASYVASPAAPTQCNNVSLAMNNNAAITLSTSAEVYGLTFTIAASSRSASLSANGNTLTVNSDAVIDVLSGNTSTNIYIGEMGSGAGVVDFKGNFKIGETYYSTGNVPRSYIVGNVNSKITFRGDVLFGRSARFTLPGSVGYPPSYPLAAPGAGTTPGTIEFDGPGLQQVLWNNNVWYDCFYNIVVGNQNKPYVRHVTGTYTPDNILNDFTINDGCTVDLGTSQWIREQSGGTFTMNGSAKLILGNYQAIQSNCGGSCHTGVTIPGSNFPGGFATLNISPTSTIEYNGGSSMTQTVYATPTYGNLILSNTNNTGNAPKVSTGVVTISGVGTISDKTTFTPGANITLDGSLNVNSGGTLVCGTNIVSGTGTFSLLSGGTITMASTAGITASGATGNIQTDTRSFSTGGNYTYNASSAQATGNGLPTTVNNLTISNAAGVTMYAASSNYTVAGTLGLTTGALAINGDSLTINNLTRTSGTLTGSSTSSVGITGTNIPLFFTAGGRVLKNLFLNTNASADLETLLDITAGSSAGSVAVGSGAVLTTDGNLTLKSDANGTARVSEIPVNGSGIALGSISGNVTIERYIPAKRSWRLVTAPVQASGSQTINTAWQEGVVNTDLTNNQNPNPGYGTHISGSSPTLGFDATPLNNPSLKVFTRSNSSWGGIANTLSTYVRDYEGYMLFVRGGRSTNLSLNTGAPLSNTIIREKDGIRMGRQSVTLSSGAGSYSVVGNPYPSTIDFRTLGISGLGSTKTFVMWDPALTGTQGVGAYQYFTQVGGAGTDYAVFPGGGSYGVSGTVNNYVQSGQAFLVQNTGAATLTINENSKASPSTSTVFRPMPDNITGKISTILYRMDADSSMMVVDGGLVIYRSEYDDNLDLEDVKKLNNTNSENFGINKNTAIYQIEKRQSINEEDSIQYSMKNLVARPYHLAIDLTNMEAAGVEAYLKDNFTNTLTRLNFNNTNIYPFVPTVAAAGSYAADRFKVVFKPMTVLPVTFTSLDAYRKQNAINVEWKTANEGNIRNYIVEKSADGRSFTKQSSNISTNNSSKYQWTDEQPLQGFNYYRVKSIEANGRSKYSNIVKVLFSKQAANIAVFPNPVSNGNINLYFTEQLAGIYTAKLFNNAGQLVHTEKMQSTGSGNANITMDNGLPHGNYILEITKPDSSKEHINIVY